MVADIESDSESMTEQDAVRVLESAIEDSRSRKAAAAKKVHDTGYTSAVDITKLLG
jgi:ribosomal protein S7